MSLSNAADWIQKSIGINPNPNANEALKNAAGGAGGSAGYSGGSGGCGGSISVIGGVAAVPLPHHAQAQNNSWGGVGGGLAGGMASTGTVPDNYTRDRLLTVFKSFDSATQAELIRALKLMEADRAMKTAVAGWNVAPYGDWTYIVTSEDLMKVHAEKLTEEVVLAPSPDTKE